MTTEGKARSSTALKRTDTVTDPTVDVVTVLSTAVVEVERLGDSLQSCVVVVVVRLGDSVRSYAALVIKAVVRLGDSVQSWCAAAVGHIRASIATASAMYQVPR